MNDNDFIFEGANAVYVEYLEVIAEATEEQSRLADNIYYFLRELQEKCNLYKNSDIEKPENHIRKVIRRNNNE